jgi:hypothetical protein
MSTGLRVAVVAIVILIIALIILAILSGVFNRYGTLADARNGCELEGRGSCSTAGTLPITWEFYFRVGDQTTSCRDLVAVPGATDDNPCGSWKV